MVPPSKLSSDARAADDEVLALWMSQYGAALRRFFARRVSAADADDLVQEVFLKLQRSTQAAATDNVESLLFTVARSVLIDRFRGEKNHRLLDFPDSFPDPADDISPERILAAKQDYARAMVAILNLSPREQTIFMLHRFSKLSYSTIAKRMGVSQRTVRGIMERAIGKILAHMRGTS